MHKASKRNSASLVLATAALSLFALHCSSEDDPPPGGVAGTGTIAGTDAGGTAAGGTAAGGGGAGGSAAGTAAGGGGAGGTAAGGGGAGGSSAGGGGSSAGGGGAGGGGAGGGGAGGGGAGGGGAGGGPSVTFAQVRTLLGESCAVGDCHNQADNHIDWDTAQGLYTRLTSPIGAEGMKCKGSTPVVKGMPNESLLVQIMKGGNPAACKTMGGQTENVGRMPNLCNGNTCLSEDKIKLVSDWIAAGAPEN